MTGDGDTQEATEVDPLGPREEARSAGWKLWLRRAFTIGILGFIIWRLTLIGWGELWRNLPTEPLFYVLHFTAYSVLPLSEIAIFSLIWGVSMSGTFGVMLRKRALNNSVIGYSGEVYLYLWAKARFGLTGRRLASGLKDNVLMSGIATALCAIVAALTLLWINPDLVHDRLVERAGPLSIGLFAVLIVAVLILFYVFRAKIFGIGGRIFAIVMALHFARIGLTYILQAWQWDVGVPAGTAELWFTLITVQLVISQLPLLPNRDLIYLAFVIEYAGSTGVNPQDLQAMFVTIFVLYQLLNYTALAVTSLLPSTRVAVKGA
mgnify:FL=1